MLVFGQLQDAEREVPKFDIAEEIPVLLRGPIPKGRGCPALQIINRRVGEKKVVTTAVANTPVRDRAANCWLSSFTNSL